MNCIAKVLKEVNVNFTIILIIIKNHCNEIGSNENFEKQLRMVLVSEVNRYV